MGSVLGDENGDNEANITVIKKTLNKLCMDASRQQLCASIRGLVFTMNCVVAEAYLFANFHVTRCLSEPAFDVVCLPKLDRNFYYRCLLAVSKSNVRKGTLGKSLTDSMDAFDALRPMGWSKTDVRPWGQVIADISIQMATMACNSVWANVDRVVVKYLRLKHPALKKHFVKIVRAVVHYPKSDVDKIIPSQYGHAAQVKKVVSHLRLLLPLPTGHQFNTRAHLTMRLFHSVLSELVAATSPTSSSSSNRRLRLFSLLPCKSGFTMSYVPISSMTLMKLLSMGDKPLERIRGDGRDEDHSKLWRKYFNVGGVETRASRFDNRILSDGKGVSIQMRRKCGGGEGASAMDVAGYPKDVSIGECLHATTHRDAQYAGVDPGMTDIVTVAFSTGGVKSYSSSHFSDAAGYKTSKRRTDKWNAETADLVRSIPPPTTSSVEGMQHHVRGYLAALPTLLQHRASKGYRSMRFLRFVGKQKAIEKVCDVIAPKGMTTVVGFGNWSNQGSGISRPCSGPLKEIRKRLSRRQNVLFKNVDERNTSCTCHGCFHKLVNMKADSVRWRKAVPGGDGSLADASAESTARVKTVVKNVKVHKVLHCSNSVKSAPNVRCGTTWNRDANAAKNILLLLTTWIEGRERPAAFCVPSNNTVSREAKGCTRPIDPTSGSVGSTRSLSLGPAFNS